MAAISGDLYGQVRKELEKSNNLMLMRIIGFAMISGLVIFLAIILYFYFTQGSDTADSPTIELYLSIVNVVLFAASYVARGILVNLQFKQNKPYESAQTFINTFQSATIIKFALMEGAGFFAAVTLLLSVFSGVVNYNELYWLNGLVTVLCVFLIYKAVPAKEDVLQRAREFSR